MVAALPAIVAGGSDVLVLEWLAPIVTMADVSAEVIPFRRGYVGFAAAVRELRRRGYREGVLLTPAFSAAWLFRCAGVRGLRGTATDGRSLLLRDRVAPELLRPLHRIHAYGLLMEQTPGAEPRSVRLAPPVDALERARTLLPMGEGPLVGLVPGSNAPARRWPVDRFGEVARTLVTRGARVAVMGSTREIDLTARVSRAAPLAVDLGGRTDVVDLAAVLSLCDLVVTNDTGAMHLAGAVGTPTVSLWGSSDPMEVRQVGAPDRRVTGPSLPCRPCRRNHCARRGAGTLLAEAHEECMRLIEVRAVLDAVDAALADRAGSGPTRAVGHGRRPSPGG